MECKDDEKCLDCIWSRGAIKHFCVKRGGDATFEPAGQDGLGKVFEPYKLKDGWIAELQKKAPDWPGMAPNGMYIDIKSKEHERATMEAMGQATGRPIHFAEPGEKPGGHLVGPADLPAKKVFGFVGKHGKASTCR